MTFTEELAIALLALGVVIGLVYAVIWAIWHNNDDE